MRFGFPGEDDDDAMGFARLGRGSGEDFILFVIGEGASTVQEGHVRAEWRERSSHQQAVLDQCMAWITLVRATIDAVAKRLPGDLRKVKQNKKSAPTDRLWHLDAYDNDLHQQLNAYKEYISALDNLERTYVSMNPTGPFILRATRSLQKRVNEESVEIEQEASKTRSDLYDLKRRSPGRKAKKKNTKAEFKKMERQAYAQMRNMDGPNIQHPNLPQNPLMIRWHQAHLKNSGFMNDAMDVCLGIAWDGTIVDRKVRKSVRHEDDTFGSSHKWWHYPNGDAYPLEYVTQRMVCQSREARFAIQTLSEPSVEANQRLFHLYLEFAPCGDVDNLIDEHIRVRRPIPETFIMLVFQSLIENTMIMKKNSTNTNARMPSDWLECVHRDLKPANIFLALPNEIHFPCFPTPKLADYGLGALTHEDDPLNPIFYNAVGTSGYDAPEQSNMWDSVTGKGVDDFPILSPCNVWAIGAVMYSLMTLKDLLSVYVDPLPYCVNVGKKQAVGTEFERSLDKDLKKKWGHLRTYNAALRNAVQKCMSFLPEARPGIEDLKEWIDAEMQENEVFRRAKDGWGCEGGLYFQEEKEQWKLGMCWPPSLGRGRRDFRN